MDKRKWKTPRFIRPFIVTNASGYEDSIFGGIYLPELTDITIQIVTCSANNTSILANMDIIVIGD